MLVGGWVPQILIGDSHIGSIDIDLAIDRESITPEVYRTIGQLLNRRGYRAGSQPYIFLKDVTVDEGAPIIVEVDFLASQYGGAGRNRRTQFIQDIRARKALACELVFQNYQEIEITGRMTDGAKNSVTLRITKIVPFIIMKSFALRDRLKEKDAWDIYFCVKNYPGGLERLCEEFIPFINYRSVNEGLLAIRSKFSSIEGVGPSWVVAFEEITDREAREELRRDAFEQIDALLRKLLGS